MRIFVLVSSVIAVLAGCATGGDDGRAKATPTPVIEPGADYALIHFLHPMEFLDLPIPYGLGGGPFSVVQVNTPGWYQIWDKDNLIGFLPPWDRYVQYRASPGEHVFLARSMRPNAGNWTVLKANVQAGKTYYVRVTPRWNTWKPSVSLEVLKPDYPRFDHFTASLKPYAVDRTRGDNAKTWDDHVKKNTGIVQEVVENVRKGSQDYYFDPDLKPEDGK
jgi:hypothetical protein